MSVETPQNPNEPTVRDFGPFICWNCGFMNLHLPVLWCTSCFSYDWLMSLTTHDLILLAAQNFPGAREAFE